MQVSSNVRNLIMDLNKIPDLFDSFARKYGYEYDYTTLPYIPFGAIKGRFQDCEVNMYIYRSETSITIHHHTLFAVPDYQIFPNGFCIEYSGFPDRQDRPFYEQISILSPERKIVTDFLNDNLASILITSFDKIDLIDQSILNVRSDFRLSESGFSLSTDKIFETVAALNIAFTEVMKVLTELKFKLASNM